VRFRRFEGGHNRNPRSLEPQPRGRQENHQIAGGEPVSSARHAATEKDSLAETEGFEPSEPLPGKVSKRKRRSHFRLRRFIIPVSYTNCINLLQLCWATNPRSGASDPRRAAQTRHRDQSSDSRQVHAAQAWDTFADLAQLSEQSESGSRPRRTAPLEFCADRRTGRGRCVTLCAIALPRACLGPALQQIVLIDAPALMGTEGFRQSLPLAEGSHRDGARGRKH